MLPPNSLLIDKNKKLLEVTVVTELLSVGEVRGEMDNITNIDPLNTDLPPRSSQDQTFLQSVSGPISSTELCWVHKGRFLSLK